MRGKITTLAIALSAPDEFVDQLRSKFPDVDISRIDQDDVADAILTADAVVAQRVPEDALKNAKNLKWIHRGAAGVEDLITPTLKSSDIILTNSSGVHASNIAEHILAMMLAFARGIPWFVRRQEQHSWNRENLPDSFELTGQTLVLLGIGDIGQATAMRGKALGMETIGVRRNPDAPRPDGVDTVVSVERMHEALSRADHIANSMPFTQNTHGLVGAEEFKAVKRGAYYYTVGRGRTTDTSSLIAVLKDGTLAGAGLDVTDPEPLTEDSELWDMKNVLITAHTAGRTPHTWSRVFKIIETNLRRYNDGEPLVNVVDVEAGY
jgi:phosphoglycerate dehydrogenase-like enzyme